ncbi:MAG: hypothetical protein HZY74_12125 [Brevundimonas sp.]|nr:MAG: hypothetical protein HZY74_12125 [Brevundimonas sp.]
MTEKSLMAATGDYLARHFVSAEQLGAPSGVSEAEVWTLVEGGQLPQPSYQVRGGHLVSVAFESWMEQGWQTGPTSTAACGTGWSGLWRGLVRQRRTRS